MGIECCSRGGPAATAGPPKHHDNIWKACQEGCLDSVKSAISENPEAMNTPGPIDQVPPLHWAALNGHLEVCRYLLESGAAVNQLGGDQWSTALHWAACRGQIGVMSVLIEKGADFTSLRDQQGYLPIHIAAQHGQTFSLLYLISLSKKEMINVPDLNGRTPLIWASYRGHDEVTFVLLGEGASVDQKDRSGSTALHWASIKGNAVIVKQLLAAGANPHEPDEDGKSAIDLAKEKAWPWINQVLKETGHRPVTDRQQQQTADLESGLLQERKQPRKWLPERFFKPLLDDSSLKFLLGRILPPLIALVFFYVVAYSFNIFVGIGLGLLLIGAARALYFLIQPVSDLQHDKSLAVLNSLHHTVLVLSSLVNIFVFIPSGTSAKITLGVIQICSIGVIYLLVLVEKMDAGRIGQPKSEEELHSLVRELADGNKFNRRNFCITCRAGKPLRSKHCGACGMCVARYDHHCPWTNNCIGAGNHKLFATYLLVSTIGSFAFSKASWNYFSSFASDTLSSDWWILRLIFWAKMVYENAPFVLVISYVVASGFIGISFLTAFQLFNIARNRTTNEYANSWRLEYLQNNPKTVLKDQGILGNCFKFFISPQDPDWYSMSLKQNNTEQVQVNVVGGRRYSMVAPTENVVIEFKQNIEDVRIESDSYVRNSAQPNL